MILTGAIMIKQQWIWIGVFGYVVIQAQLANASEPEFADESPSTATSDGNSNEVRLVVDLQLDKAVYGQTRYKNPHEGGSNSGTSSAGCHHTADTHRSISD